MASATELLPEASAKMIADPLFSQILQSDPVKRLFNQPNIVIHAIPRTNSPTAYRMIRPKPTADGNNENNNVVQELPEKSELSVKVVDKNETIKEEENLLPSKNNGKSEILLVPIVRTRKTCGHFEPCESLVCDVIVQQYEDEEGITPLISVNIEEDDEIEAPAAKHCENKNCDALSIDHNRCRRALIQLYHCDKHSVCDICGITLTSIKARLNHKRCRRKSIYQYNVASPIEIFKLRMRERELQILEAARLKRTEEYLDPVKGFSRTMEALLKKDELIIIPKMPPADYKPLIPNSMYKKKIFNSHKRNKKYFKKRKLQSQNNNKELTSEMISDIIKSCQNYITNKNQKIKALPAKKIMLSDHFNGATVNIMNVPNESTQDCIDLNDLSGNNPIVINNQQQTNLIAKAKSPLNNVNLNLLEQPMPKATDTLVKVKNPEVKEPEANQSFPTPYKVVPIAELKSQPSALHQQQGVPQFCVVPDTVATDQLAATTPKQPAQGKKRGPKPKNQGSPSKSLILSAKTSKVLTSGKFRPLLPALTSTPRNVEAKLGLILLGGKRRGRKRLRKKIVKGKFKCTYCPKRFPTLDCCKLHIAKHENNPSFFCRLCEKGFLNKYLMNKHIDADHKPGQVRCEVCSGIFPSPRDLSQHMRCPEEKIFQDCSLCDETFDTCGTLDLHLRREHGFLICTLCNRQIATSKVCRHLILEHSLSRSRSEKNTDKLYRQPSEGEEVREINLVNEVAEEETITEEVVEKKEEVVIKTDPVSEPKVGVDCLARNRSIRRRSLKESFVCGVCDRRFENEKQYQIHLSNNPMKFTVCPVCSKKFHRKSEYTEHSKTCGQNSGAPVVQAPKRKKPSATKVENILKSENVIESENSIDQKRKENLGLKKSCKKLKLNDDKVVQKQEDKQEDGNILKSNVENKIVNGLKSDSKDCLGNLKVIEIENNVEEKNDNDVIIRDKNQVILLDSKKSKLNSNNESENLEKSRAMTTIIQDHNYLA